MKSNNLILSLSISLLLCSCITKFIPEVNEKTDLMVVDGMITDQPGFNKIKLYKSMPLGKKADATPITGCSLLISDDLGNSYDLSETEPGTYVTDSAEFCGIAGRKYTLKIFTNSTASNNYSYESLPMEMKPVPPISKIYYEKRLISEGDQFNNPKEGCQVFLDTSDPEDKCRYYRWDYQETWEFRLPYQVTNKVCWISNNSSTIEIKNTSVFTENKISGFPLKFISDETDRLRVKYSMLVNQYSLNEDEYNYWEKTQNISQDVGTLFDITPASVPSNIYCIEDPYEKVLGYFSVSAKTSKRIFIEDYFPGIVNLYLACETGKQWGDANDPIPFLGTAIWVIIDRTNAKPPYRILTNDKNCADCTARGSNIKPVYWDDVQ